MVDVRMSHAMERFRRREDDDGNQVRIRVPSGS